MGGEARCRTCRGVQVMTFRGCKSLLAGGASHDLQGGCKSCNPAVSGWAMEKIDFFSLRGCTQDPVLVVETCSLHLRDVSKAPRSGLRPLVHVPQISFLKGS